MMQAQLLDPGPTRDRVLDLVRQRAWTPRELGEVLGVDRKTADYHLHALRRQGLVAERWVHGERRFALALGAPAAFASASPARTRARVAQAVEQRGLLGLEDLAREVGISRGLAAYHVRRLAAEDIVRVRRRGQRVLVQAKGLAVQAEEVAVAG
jgi:DNA-binding transcriptional ArsR family regulator